MTQLPEMYSAEDFHTKFPATNVSVETWYHWLAKWRNYKPPKLVRNIHWMYSLKNGNGSTIVYLPKPVLRLIMTDATACYFGSQFEGAYGNRVRAYISTSGTSEPLADITASSE